MLGRYLIVSVLGRGGMGVVYKAYDTQLDRPIAIKILRRELAKSEDIEDMESRMLREAQAMARLIHPNVVAVHDVGTFDHRVFLAMDFVDGCTLKEWLTRKPPWREVHAVLLAAGRGLEAAHRAGLIHRDFKPDNVLIGNDGRVLVTDFGLARADEPRPVAPLPPRVLPPPPPKSGSRASQVALASPLTLTGSVLGTIGYMAPEQAFGEPTNASTDQFSYCVTAWAAFSGESGRFRATTTRPRLPRLGRRRSGQPPRRTARRRGCIAPSRAACRSARRIASRRWARSSTRSRATRQRPRARVGGRRSAASSRAGW